MVSRKDDRLTLPGPGLAEKLLRALALLYAAREQFGDRLAVERDLSRDSCVVWELARRVDPGIKGFFVAAQLRAGKDIRLAEELTVCCAETPARGRAAEGVPDADPGLRRRIAEVRARAREEDGPAFRNCAASAGGEEVACWVSGLRAPAARPWLSLGEFQELDRGLARLCPILDWTEDDALRYVVNRKIAVPVST